MDLFECPAPAYLESIPIGACPVRWDQVQKLILRRIDGRTDLTKANIILSATITPLLTATDDTKIVVSPFMSNVVIPQGEILKEGGNDNTTLNGIPQLRGLGFVNVTAQIRNANSDTVDVMRALTPESALQPGQTNLEVILVNKDGKLIVREQAGSGSRVEGFPIYNFTVSDVGSAGFAQDNINNIGWDFAPGWSEGHRLLTPTDYAALTLSNGVSTS
ncbi:MAG: hypothetical protein JNK14_05775 [Chitinophagaceae bacterium]|nr:hypothetical protein [Chitinophagaceae bacterium]